MGLELSQRKRSVAFGEPTAGGEGVRFPSSLPGGGEFPVGAFKPTYPDGTEYMEVGIQPDVEIRVSLEDILRGKDRALEKALEVAQNWESSI